MARPCLKKKESSKTVQIRLLNEELMFAHLEISRLETQLRILKNQVKDTELRSYGANNASIGRKLQDITVGQYTAPTISCEALRRSQDTNR